MSNADIYLKATMSLIARQTFSPEKLRELVSARGTEKNLRAFNMCDGEKSQTEIATDLKIDAGQFSRTVKQWMDDGIIIKVGDGRNARLVHVYPLPEKYLKSFPKKAA